MDNQDQENSFPSFHFYPKQFWSIKNNMLSGICFIAWIKLIWKHKSNIEWIRYSHRILFLTIMSLFNSLLSIPDYLFYRNDIKNQKINQRPVFILGHPRTGTTHLHNLLSLDTEQFAFSNTFQVGFPSSFLTCENIGSTLLSPILDKTRPMDNMKLSFSIPQEDELATNVLSSGCSPYMPLIFPSNEKYFRKYYCFEKDICEEEQYNSWLHSFLYFLKKITLKTRLTQGDVKAKELRLLIKSPVHTARVELLLDLFPNAQFIYIHRHPFDVFKSATHMADSYYWYCHLQSTNDKDIMEFILHQYDLLFDKYMESKTKIPIGNLYEISFNELDTNPMKAIGDIYNHFNWNNFDTMKPIIESYTDSLSNFKKNSHRDIPEEWKEYLYKRWNKSFKEFGYEYE